MNKDAILATIIGFVIGLLITGILLVGPRLVGMIPKISFTMPKFYTAQSKSKLTPTPTPTINTLTIESPLADSIEQDSDLLVSGKAPAGSTVVIQGNATESISSVKSDSKYAGKITLVEGVNEITVTSFLSGKQTTQTVTVYYTPETF
ncbi:MAG TPA: hypothetical protein VMR81_00535 [Patescibacteria group bacterium]|jgi:hypothetical protein|nr:hypothetical protein [Patescibacteria group bacterium]